MRNCDQASQSSVADWSYTVFIFLLSNSTDVFSRLDPTGPSVQHPVKRLKVIHTFAVYTVLSLAGSISTSVYIAQDLSSLVNKIQGNITCMCGRFSSSLLSISVCRSPGLSQVYKQYCTGVERGMSHL